MSGEAMRRDMVLVVDDNRDELKLLVDALELAGLTALAATSGEAALTLAEGVMPQAVVMDARMGGIDGFEACRRLKQDGRFSHVPVLFLTGLTDTLHVLEGLEAGGVDYVTKPVILAELIARIRIHISNAKAAFGARVALDASGRHLLAVDSKGHLAWTTPQAASLLAQTFGTDGVLPADLARGLAEIAGRGKPGAELAFGEESRRVSASLLCENGPDEYLFRLIPAMREVDLLCQAFALTQREAEVLLWIARGKSNPDISGILGISPRTVDKHSERIFAKLGAENRTAAAALALHSLGSGV